MALKQERLGEPASRFLIGRLVTPERGRADALGRRFRDRRERLLDRRLDLGLSL